MDRSVKVSRRLVLVALVLIGPIVALTPLAYSTPLDPSWICGIYDAADYDDVVLLITSEAGRVTPSCYPSSFRAWSLLGFSRMQERASRPPRSRRSTPAPHLRSSFRS